MIEETDKREHSTKPEVDDLTDYQSLNSLGGAGVRGSAKETQGPEVPQKELADSDKDEPAADVIPAGEYNDAADIAPIDNKANTNT